MNHEVDEQKMLAAMPGTRQEISDATGYHRTTVYNWLKRQREAGRVYVKGYDEDDRGRMTVSIYALGKKTDAPRVGQRWTSAERMRRLRAERRALV